MMGFMQSIVFCFVFFFNFLDKNHDGFIVRHNFSLHIFN